MTTLSAAPVVRNVAEQNARKKRSRTAKYEGDDMYSWALFIDGRAVYTGMSVSEARWRRDVFIQTGDL